MPPGALESSSEFEKLKLWKLPINRDIGQGWQGVGLAGAMSVVMFSVGAPCVLTTSSTTPPTVPPEQESICLKL